MYISEQRWGVGVHAWVGLHRREPTEREVDKAVAKKKYDSISPDDIKQAFDLGQEASLAVSFIDQSLQQFTDVKDRSCWCGV